MVLVKSLTGVKVLWNPVSVGSPEAYTVSAEERKFYEDNGYLVIKKLIDFTSLYSFKQHFIRICNGVVSTGNMRIIKEPSLVGQNLKPEEYINKISEILYDDVFISYGEHPAMLSVLSQLLGAHVTAVNSMLINKPPGATFHPPHQDLFYFPFRPAEKIIGAWTAIDDVNFENGCLFVVPGSHKPKELYAHAHKKEALKMYHGVVDEATIAPLEKRVHLDMGPGDTVFLNPYLVHGSGPNVSKTYRKSITFHFAHSSCQYIDVRGTKQEHLAKEVEDAMNKQGFHMDYIDLWKAKSRQVKGVRSNL